jgi:cell division protein FtsW
MTNTKNKIDYCLLGSTGLLLLLGILILAAVSFYYSQQKTGMPDSYFFGQFLKGIIPGLILGFILFKTPLRFIKKGVFFFLILSAISMALVFVPGLRISAGGASRWVHLGIVSFQPAEFLKLAFILYLSLWLANRTKKNNKEGEAHNHGQTFLSFVAIIGAIAFLLFLQKDLSTLAIIVASGIFMFFSGQTSMKQNIAIILISIAILGVMVCSEGYRLNRVLSFFGATNNFQGDSYQSNQAIMAVGSGGFFGQGLGTSNINIPEAMTDSIFAILAQETGFLGGMVLVFGFLFFLWRIFKLSWESDDEFSRFFAIGVGVWICGQAFLNIFSSVGLLPVSGVPLPFISHGGSHLITELSAIGILLNISKSAKKVIK